jgi:hypothetical protein
MLATRLAPLALAVVFASCSGGGAGGSGGGTTLSAPLAGPTPSGAAVPVVTGTAVDDATGRPIAGAVVYVSGGTAIAGATPLPATAETLVEFWLYETQHGSVPSAQNISEQSASGSWQAAEAAFMAETLSAPALQYYAENFSTPSGISTIESALLGPCAAISAPSSTSIPPQPRTKAEQRRYNSCASFPASRARHRPNSASVPSVRYLRT